MTSDVSPDSSEDRLAPDPLEQEFSVALARIIESAAEDPAQLRNTIYELARIMLQREAWQSSPGTDSSEMRRRSRALEPAMARVEAIASQLDAPRAAPSPEGLIKTPDPGPHDPAAGARGAARAIGLGSMPDRAAASPASAQRPPPM